MSELGRLLRRAEFLAVAARGRRWVAPGMIVQFLPRNPQDDCFSQVGEQKAEQGESVRPPERFAKAEEEKQAPLSCLRYGLTASRKVGNAVVRNRARRRLRSVAEDVLPESGLPCGDVVLIARKTATVSRSYDDLQRDLRWSIRRLCPKNDS